jgi:hypothetical protein
MIESSSLSNTQSVVVNSSRVPAGFRARETYKILGPDEFNEVFEIAEPGKDFELYSEGHFKRKK